MQVGLDAKFHTTSCHSCRIWVCRCRHDTCMTTRILKSLNSEIEWQMSGRFRSVFKVHLPIEMPTTPPQNLCPTDSPTTNGHPTHVAGTHLQRKWSLDNAATKASRLTRRWAIMDQTGRQNSMAPKPGGGFSGKTKPSGYTTLFGTREQSCYASSHVPFVRRDSPPRAQI